MLIDLVSRSEIPTKGVDAVNVHVPLLAMRVFDPGAEARLADNGGKSRHLVAPCVRRGATASAAAIDDLPELARHTSSPESGTILSQR
jgi:hypothetical protein